METKTKNHDAPGEPPGNHRNGQYAPIAIGFLLGWAVWNVRAKNQPFVYVERIRVTDDVHGRIYYDSRRPTTIVQRKPSVLLELF